MSQAVIIQNLHKSYDELEALKGVDLEIAQGEFFGLLGPNGAGKTTLINTIVGLARFQRGAIRVLGHDVTRDSIRSKALIGLSPQEPNIDRYFKVKKILEFQGGFYGLGRQETRERAQSLMAQFNLTEKADVSFYKLSGGMQKRILIARSLMSRPSLLILDEPTAGIDVEQRHEAWGLLKTLNRDGTTIILTTHYIDEAQKLCDRVGVIHKGKIVEVDSPQGLIDKHCEKRVEVILSQSPPPDLFEGLASVMVKEETVVGYGSRIGPLLDAILQRIIKQSTLRVQDIQVFAGSLEEVFIKLTGSSIHNMNASRVLPSGSIPNGERSGGARYVP